MYQYYNKTATTNKASPVDGFGAPDSWLAMDWATETPASLLDCSCDGPGISWLCCTELDSSAILQLHVDAEKFHHQDSDVDACDLKDLHFTT